MQPPTNRQLTDEFHRIMDKIFSGYFWLLALFAFLVIMPLEARSIWRDSSSLILKLVEIAIYCSLGWAIVSLLRAVRMFRELGLTPMGRLKVLSGPRPDDPDELRLWKSVWQFLIALIATMVSMAALVAIDWLSKK